jgi:hypothetical protein
MKKKRVIRSFSIDQDTLNRLHASANQRKISVNALITEILDYYLEIGIHGSTIGLIHIAHPTFRVFLDSCNKDLLITNASLLGGKACETWIELRDLNRDLPSFLNHIMYHQPKGWAKISINEYTQNVKITFIHDFGDLWSKFLEAWFSAAYETMMGKRLPQGSFKTIDKGLIMTIAK